MMVVPLIAAAKAGEVASSAGGAVAKAMTTPIISRKKIAMWDEANERWVPVSLESEANVTPAGLAVVGLLALGAAAVVQRATRTGTIEWVDETAEKRVLNPAHKAWVEKRKAFLIEHAGEPIIQADMDYASGPEPPRTVIAEVTRKRPRIRSRDNMADYQPIGRVL